MADKKTITGVVIHGFAAAHATTAFLLSQTVIGDEIALTGLTVTMIVSISKINGQGWGVGEGLSLIGTMAGGYLGSRGAMLLVKWIPGIGNTANAITTTVVTEILGWSTYLLVKEGKKPNELSEQESKNLYKKARKMREEMKKVEKLIKSMSSDDKAEYDRLINKLKERDLPDTERDTALEAIQKLVDKYPDI